MESIEDNAEFEISEEDFEKMAEWYLAFSEKRELLGNTNHLLYICKKENFPGTVFKRETLVEHSQRGRYQNM